ncbi:MAG: MATE family efflux transporter [Clostridia bacterium]|nr:MATE family efflux transporter [Clostridia bacterium]
MLFTKQELKKMIVPMFVENVLSVTVGMADTVMVARAGEAAVSGVSLVDSVNLLILYFIGALSSGGAILIAQAIGAKNERVIKDAQKQLFWISVIISSIISLIIVISHRPLLRLIFGSISAEIMANAQIYFLITALSLPFLAIRNAVGAAYRSFGITKVSMNISLLTNVINVGGNALLIFGFGMGAAGAATSTLFARFIGAVLSVVLVLDKKRPVYIEKLFHYRPDGKLIKRILQIGLPSAFENSVFQLGKVMTQSLVSTFGTVAIAANATANTLTSMLYVPGTTMSGAITTVVGRCVGADEPKQAKKYARNLVGLAYLFIITMALVMWLLSKQLVGLFNLSAESQPLAINLVLFHNAFVCTVWPIAFTLPNAFRAASDVNFTMILSIVSMWLFRVGGSFFFAKTLEFGIYGVWMGMACDWVFRAAVFGIRYLRGTWLTKYKK